MLITSSYKMKLTGDLKALETSINIYRDALRMLIPIINDNWETLSEYNLLTKNITTLRNGFTIPKIIKPYITLTNSFQSFHVI